MPLSMSGLMGPSAYARAHVDDGHEGLRKERFMRVTTRTHA